MQTMGKIYIDIVNEVREEHIMNSRHEEENVNINHEHDARRKRDRNARLFRQSRMNIRQRLKILQTF
jgi:GTP:adenosylcobinamide-phosphate guanylyltransferase